jgi:hypothetical protein
MIGRKGGGGAGGVQNINRAMESEREGQRKGRLGMVIKVLFARSGIQEQSLSMSLMVTACSKTGTFSCRPMTEDDGGRR